MYKVVYLPIACRQLEDAVAYIAENLCAPDAADDLINAVDEAVRALSEMQYRHALYPLLFAMKREIRFVPVRNYNLFYVVNEEQKTVEIWRFIHQFRAQKRPR